MSQQIIRIDVIIQLVVNYFFVNFLNSWNDRYWAVVAWIIFRAIFI